MRFCNYSLTKNLKYEPTKVIEWCKEQFVRLDTIKFEKERQAELKAMYDFVQAVDRELEMLIKSKKQ